MRTLNPTSVDMVIYFILRFIVRHSSSAEDPTVSAHEKETCHSCKSQIVDAETPMYKLMNKLMYKHMKSAKCWWDL